MTQIEERPHCARVWCVHCVQIGVATCGLSTNTNSHIFLYLLHSIRIELLCIPTTTVCKSAHSHPDHMGRTARSGAQALCRDVASITGFRIWIIEPILYKCKSTMCKVVQSKHTKEKIQKHIYRLNGYTFCRSRFYSCTYFMIARQIEFMCLRLRPQHHKLDAQVWVIHMIDQVARHRI